MIEPDVLVLPFSQQSPWLLQLTDLLTSRFRDRIDIAAMLLEVADTKPKDVLRTILDARKPRIIVAALDAVSIKQRLACVKLLLERSSETPTLFVAAEPRASRLLAPPYSTQSVISVEPP